VSHVNALLTPRGRLGLARCVVEDGWTLRRAAERFQVSPTTAARWAGRYRQLGPTGMVDRSSRPHRSPRRTPQRRQRRIIGLRVTRRWGPARIGWHWGLHPSTVHRVLARWGLTRLRWLDRPTGRVVRRYEHAAPGDMIHVDIKKLGRIPDGGGHRVMARAAAYANKKATTTARYQHGRPKIGYHFLHTAVDDHSRLA
jgi:transposase